MAKLLFMRHGFTIANNARWNNQPGISEHIKSDRECPLEKSIGAVQVAEAGNFLKEKFKEKRVLVFVSPYLRPRESAQIIYQKVHKSVGSIQFKIVEALREIDQGAIFAKNYDEQDQELGKDEAAYFRDMKKSKKGPGLPFPYGESEVEVRRRILHFVKHDLLVACSSEEYDYVLVVAHDTVNKWLYYIINDNFPPQQPTAAIIENGGGIIFEPTTLVPHGYVVDLDNIHANKKK